MNILKHSESLGNFGISLHSRIVESLVNQIEDAIAEGLIRCTMPIDNSPQLFSIYDFILEILQQKTQREVWKRYTEADPNIVTFCDYVPFDQKSGYPGKPSPAADMAGLLYIAYMANCKFSQKLRASSAALIAADHRAVIAPVQPEPKPAAITPAPASSQNWTRNQPSYQPIEFDRAQFPRSISEVQQVTGIKTRAYIMQAVKRDYVAGVDYVRSYPELFLTEDVFYWLVVSFRSSRGTDVKTLPQTIPLDRGGFQVKNNRKNSRLPSKLN